MARAAAAALIPWLILVALWELASARGWMTTVLFPPPSSFIRFAVESDFRVGFGQEGMTIPVAILASAFRVVACLFLGFIAAVATGILVSMSRAASAAVLPIVRGLAPIAPIAAVSNTRTARWGTVIIGTEILKLAFSVARNPGARWCAGAQSG